MLAPAYQGDGPFVFVCYAHEDQHRVYPELDWLREQGINLWYDEGISAGENWRARIGDALERASHVLFYISQAALGSQHCNREVSLALDEGKTVVPVYLEDVPLTSDLKVGLNRVHALKRYADGNYGQHLLDALRGSQAEPSRLKPLPPRARWSGLYVALLMAALIAGGLWWYRAMPATDSPAGIARAPSVAVLPFVNMSDDAEQEYFADGLTEELLNGLAQIPELKVSGRTSSFAFKGRNVGFDVIGATLGVDHVLEGSVRRSGDSLRITAQLISVADGFHMWSATYDRPFADVFVIQREIAGAVADALSVKLGLTHGDTAYGGTRNTEAYSHYLRGRTLFYQQTPRTTERAIDELEAAVRLDPEFALAWVELTYAYGGRSREPAHTEQSLVAMAQAAARAVEVAPELWRAHAAQAFVLMSYHDFVAADEAMERALMLRRAHGMAAVGIDYAAYLAQIGRLEDQLVEVRLLQRADPLMSDGVDPLYMLGRREEAVAEFERNRGLAPGDSSPLFVRWLAMEQSDPAAMDAIVPGFSEGFMGKLLLGKHDEALATLQALLDDPKPMPRGYAATVAFTAEYHGDLDMALAFLRKEYLPYGFGSYFLMWHPALKRTRATAGFKTLVREIGMLAVWQKTGDWGEFCYPVEKGDFACR